MPINPIFLQAAQTWQPQGPTVPPTPPSPDYSWLWNWIGEGADKGWQEPGYDPYSGYKAVGGAIRSALGYPVPSTPQPATPQGWNPDLWAMVSEAIRATGRDPAQVRGDLLTVIQADLQKEVNALALALARDTSPTTTARANEELRRAASKLVADHEADLPPKTPPAPAETPAVFTNRADLINNYIASLPASETNGLLQTFGFASLSETESAMLDAAFTRTHPLAGPSSAELTSRLGYAQLDWQKEQYRQDREDALLKMGVDATTARMQAQLDAEKFAATKGSYAETARANLSSENLQRAQMMAQARNWQSQNMLTDINAQRQMYQAAMPYNLPANMQYYPGFEPGNPMSHVLQGYGMPAMPPSQVARAPIDPFAAQAALAWR